MNVVDKFGNEVNPGEEGELILTSLHDYAMPFIRYAPGDMVIKSGEKCKCGRNLPLLKKIIGRTSDLIELPNGRILNGLSIPFEMWDDRITKFQIIQCASDSIEINLITKSTWQAWDEKTVVSIMKTHVGEGIRIKSISVSVILPFPNQANSRYVISKVTNQELIRKRDPRTKNEF